MSGNVAVVPLLCGDGRSGHGFGIELIKNRLFIIGALVCVHDTGAARTEFHQKIAQELGFLVLEYVRKRHGAEACGIQNLDLFVLRCH